LSTWCGSSSGRRSTCSDPPCGGQGREGGARLMTDGHAGTTAGQPQGLTRLYLIAWLVLVAITAIEVSLLLVFRVSPAVRATALIILAIMKATLIGAYYMGLRFERLAMVYIAVIPLLLLVLMLVAVVPDVTLLLGRH